MARMARINDRDDWFEIWFADKKAMVTTMYENMTADLNAGYDPFGKSITEQRIAFENYTIETNKILDMFKGMEEKAVNRWCYYDMIKRGVIE